MIPVHAAMKPTVLESVITQLNKDINESCENNAKKIELLDRTRNGRALAAACAVISAIVGAIFTTFALTLAPVTFGLSSFLLVPASAAFTLAFDLHKVVRCFNIVDKAVEQRHRQVSSGEIQNEIRSTIALHFFVNKVQA